MYDNKFIYFFYIFYVFIGIFVFLLALFVAVCRGIMEWIEKDWILCE